MSDRELTVTEIMALTEGDTVRIGNITTNISCWCRDESFYTTEWFTDSYGNQSDCYGTNTRARDFDIGKLPVYLVTPLQHTGNTK